MSKTTQKLWRKNFDIRRVDMQMPYPVMGQFFNCQLKILPKAHVKNGIWITENSDNVGTYFIKDELRSLIKAIIEKIIQDPHEVQALHEETIKVNNEYFQLSHRIERLNFSKLSDQKLVSLYKEIMKGQILGHGISLVTTWFVDSDGEDFSKYLLSYLAGKIKKFKLKNNSADVFSVLTTPLKDSMARVEEKELLIIVGDVLKNKRAVIIFKKKDFTKVKNDFSKLPQSIKTKILKHYKKWRWTPYTYVGPVYELDYYLEIISGLVHQGVKPQKLLKEYAESHVNTKHVQDELVKKLEIDPKFWKLFKVAQDIIYIKGYRKDCLYYGCYVRDLILKEIAKRLHISFMQVKYFIPEEVGKALLKKKFSINNLNERIKFSVIYLNNGRLKILTGKSAKTFLAKQKFEKIKMDNLKELKGTCACPGKARGIIRVINLPEEIGKMKVGDIMLAHTTFPALVPAMKKASAVITEDGGITCHAAIVSRELKKPCVVGVKFALQVLKDGDIVKVDASKGVVTKIKV